MNMLDTLALSARKYEKQVVPRTGSTTFSLEDVLQAFDRHAIFELTAVKDGKPAKAVRPDDVRKHKVSLLDDGVSAIEAGPDSTYEVSKTAPTGDLSKVKIVARGPNGQSRGEIQMLVGQRSFKHYFEEDPIYGEIQRRGG